MKPSPSTNFILSRNDQVQYCILLLKCYGQASIIGYRCHHIADTYRVGRRLIFFISFFTSPTLTIHLDRPMSHTAAETYRNMSAVVRFQRLAANEQNGPQDFHV